VSAACCLEIKSNSGIVNNRKIRPVGEDQNQKERLDEDAQVEFNGKAKVFCRSYTLAKAKNTFDLL
jgi:hypothetical protein